jgi:hypothetical protein
MELRQAFEQALALFLCLKFKRERRKTMKVDFAERFKRYLAEDGKSPNTTESYVGDIVGFIKYQ